MCWWWIKCNWCFHCIFKYPEVKLVGVEPAGHGLDTDKHSATLTLGKPGQIHGMACYVLEDDQGEPLPVHSIASGLDYPGVGPQHSFLKELVVFNMKLQLIKNV
jgi:tryptophan synthase beta chain